MLVQEGADPHIKNTLGESPLQKCPSDLASVVKTFAQKQGFVAVHVYTCMLVCILSV